MRRALHPPLGLRPPLPDRASGPRGALGGLLAGPATLHQPPTCPAWRGPTHGGGLARHPLAEGLGLLLAHEGGGALHALEGAEGLDLRVVQPPPTVNQRPLSVRRGRARPQDCSFPAPGWSPGRKEQAGAQCVVDPRAEGGRIDTLPAPSPLAPHWHSPPAPAGLCQSGKAFVGPGTHLHCPAGSSGANTAADASLLRDSHHVDLHLSDGAMEVAGAGRRLHKKGQDYLAGIHSTRGGGLHAASVAGHCSISNELEGKPVWLFSSTSFVVPGMQITVNWRTHARQ